jgi:hypothetical protein
MGLLELCSLVCGLVVVLLSLFIRLMQPLSSMLWVKVIVLEESESGFHV